MNNEQLRPVLVSIAASHNRRRNSGNFTTKEMPVVQELLQRKYVMLEDDDRPPYSHWISLTESGEEKLMELNRLFIGRR